jgi:hypothetical protein
MAYSILSIFEFLVSGQWINSKSSTSINSISFLSQVGICLTANNRQLNSNSSFFFSHKRKSGSGQLLKMDQELNDIPMLWGLLSCLPNVYFHFSVQLEHWNYLKVQCSKSPPQKKSNLLQLGVFGVLMANEMLVKVTKWEFLKAILKGSAQLSYACVLPFLHVWNENTGAGALSGTTLKYPLWTCSHNLVTHNCPFFHGFFLLAAEYKF